MHESTDRTVRLLAGRGLVPPEGTVPSIRGIVSSEEARPQILLSLCRCLLGSGHVALQRKGTDTAVWHVQLHGLSLP